MHSFSSLMPLAAMPKASGFPLLYHDGRFHYIYYQYTEKMTVAIGTDSF
ncbi:hypothetical protein B4135_2389 [Caldibacillus debilis]|uniref:Uncharacterized protein n=1 Tax=Caldibacillus debilis TaxID=301148 RepID=A0A150LZK2_9BACI|nr:hypothetical protein B4135_2389 [Caldibacillus debilis]